MARSECRLPDEPPAPAGGRFSRMRVHSGNESDNTSVYLGIGLSGWPSCASSSS